MKPIGMKQIFNSVSIAAVALLSLCQVQLTFAQLNTFEAGQPIRASEMNHNFEVVQEQIEEISSSITDAGCSATQQDNSVLIECADGTSGVIAGAGAVLLIPEGVVGETPDYSAVNVGEFYWADGNGVLLGIWAGGRESTINQEVYTDYCPRYSCQQADYFTIDLTMDHTAQEVFIDPYGIEVIYTQPNCEGPPLTQNRTRKLFMLDGGYAVWSAETLPSDTLLYSTKATRYFHDGEWVDQADCVNLDEPSPGNGRFVIPYTPAPEILNAAYPVRLEQLP